MSFGVRPCFKQLRVKKKKEENAKHWQGRKRQGPLYTIRRNVNYCNHYGNEYMSMEVCNGLNENGHHRILCLNIRSLNWWAILEGLGGMTLLEDVCHWGGI